MIKKISGDIKAIHAVLEEIYDPLEELDEILTDVYEIREELYTLLENTCYGCQQLQDKPSPTHAQDGQDDVSLDKLPQTNVKHCKKMYRMR